MSSTNMLYDLSIPWSMGIPNAELQRTLSFAAELNYTTVALNYFLSPPIASNITNPIPKTFSFPIPAKLNVLRRCTLSITDPTHNHRLAALAAQYDILAIRPTTEKALLAACTSLSASDFSIISLDLTIRYPFHFKPKPLMAAINRGLRIELCYGQSMQASTEGRRNFLSNIIAIIRSTGGRGLIISSEARSVLAVRGMEDVRNLLVVWGLNGEKVSVSMNDNPRAVIVNESIRRTGYRGIVDVIESGAVEGQGEEKTKDGPKQKQKKDDGRTAAGLGKRKNDSAGESQSVEGDTMKISHRQAKRMKNAATKAAAANQSSVEDTPGIN